MKRVKLEEKLRYRPVWSGAVSGYAVTYVKRNIWKLRGEYTFEDGLQEAYLVFLKLKQRYIVDNGAWFMALFKRSLSNRFINLAGKATAHSVEVHPEPLEDGEECDYFDMLPSSDGNYGECMLFIKEAPREVRRVLDLFINTPPEVLEFFSSVWVKKYGSRPFGVKHIRKLFKLSAWDNPLEETKRYLEEACTR